MLKIGIIGAGRVGTSVGKYISIFNKHKVIGFYSKIYNDAVKSANFCNAKAFESLSDLLLSSDTLFITVTDSEIKNVWDCIDKNLMKNKTICHFSGSLSSDVFIGANDYIIYTGSIHPVYAFSDKFSSYKELNKAVFTIEGCKSFIENMKNLFEFSGNEVFVIDKDKKPLYHATASIASNHLIGLLHMTVNMLESCGFTQKDAYKVLKPLMSNNLNNALENGAEYALTGPIERGDICTVEKHLEVLNYQQKKIYNSLAQQVIEVAENKNFCNKQLQEKYRCIERILLK